MTTNRRSFLALLGLSPIAAKSVADTEIAKAAGAWNSNGLGSGGLSLVGGSPSGPGSTDVAGIKWAPWEQRLVGAADYVKAFGIPEVLEYQLRDEARAINALDPDIACKASWSMAVKLMTQRERNYQRALLRIERSAWQYRKRSALSRLLGFEWPW